MHAEKLQGKPCVYLDHDKIHDPQRGEAGETKNKSASERRQRTELDPLEERIHEQAAKQVMQDDVSLINQKGQPSVLDEGNQEPLRWIKHGHLGVTIKRQTV